MNRLSPSPRLGRLVALAAGVGLAVALGSAGAAKPACAGDVSGTCGDLTTAIFSGKDEQHSRTVVVRSTGTCALRVVARKRGESQPERYEVQPGGEASRTGKFADFTVRCGGGKGQCKGSVKGF